MTKWHDLLKQNGTPPAWPYPIRYDDEQVVEADVLVVGGGIAGCWAAISAARSGLKVALVEKGDTVRSGSGGPGCDHWCVAPANPHSKVDPDEWAKLIVEHPMHAGTPPTGPLPLNYSNGIGTQIQCREDWDTLLEMEQMGGQIRDVNDEWVGAEGRYDDKIMFSPRMSPNHATEVTIRVWGSTFKPALKKECLRLGVKVYDRTMVTSLLSEGGVQGSRVVGATGMNNRTGEFFVFHAKATVLATSTNLSMFMINTELAGMNTFPGSRTKTGDGFAMAWNAGAELTLMEMTGLLAIGTGYKHTWYGGAGDASYENVPLIDANGKKLPWPAQSWQDGGEMRPSPQVMASIREGIFKGEWELPFYGDFPAMPKIERDITWHLMLNEESATKIIVDTYERGGFDPSKHLLQAYNFIEGETHPQWKTARGGGPLVDWDLKSNLDGLYVAGEQLFSHGDHSFAACTGRYAGRKAAAYAKEIAPVSVNRDQIRLEKARVYAPIKRTSGFEWKELNAGIARVMQYFCSEYKTERLLNMGLDALNELEEVYVPKLYALDPHKLMRSIEDLSMLQHAKMTIIASLARKASSAGLMFQRIDYPEMDPDEWNKYISISLKDNKVQEKSYPLDFWGNMKENYEARNRDYTGVYSGK